ncbi:PH domain-containing protein [Lysinimonas soli]|uniref:PH domain-containing protein n=1 Tax=Lysinimonas soli TaxID=1074233 RepID=A0ABW0NTL6_9MICO
MSTDAVPESVVARLHRHSRALFWPTAFLLVDVALVAFFTGTLPEPWMNTAVPAVGGVLSLVVFVGPLLSWLGHNYTITTRRIVIRSGLLVRTRQELLHSRGYDVTVRKAGLQALFGSGDVIINTGLEHPTVLRDVPSANLVQSALNELMERSFNPIAARRQQAQSGPGDETTAWGRR